MRHPWPSSSSSSPKGEGPIEDYTRKIALSVEYDGTRYKGFQWQRGVPTVQATLERAICQLTRETVRVRGASRTDSGVHARGQVVDFNTAALYSAETFTNALNSYLPRDIRVQWAAEVSQEFSSRRWAVSRVYRYTVANTKWPPALERDFMGWVTGPLDVKAMGEAADSLKGSHDFSIFSGALRPGRSPVRQVERWEVWRKGEMVNIEAEANAFLPHQVLRTNGLLVEIGRGRLPIDTVRRLIEEGHGGELRWRSLSARGLCLMEVKYGSSFAGTSRRYEKEQNVLG